MKETCETQATAVVGDDEVTAVASGSQGVAHKLTHALRVRGDGGGTLRERRALWLMMIVGLIFSGVAFAYKIAEFISALTSEDAQGFADVPVTTYFFVAGGWLFIMFWCYITGRFRDTESAKYEMLRMEEEYERQGI